MRWLSTLRTWVFSRQIEDDVARAWRAVRDHPVLFLITIGAILRLIEYARGRTFWMDEHSIWGNIAGKRFYDFSEPLAGNQLVPHFFLVVERSLVSLLGSSRYIARLVPITCGLASLFLFAAVARRIVPPRPALVALVLFVFSTDLIYYASELKPYSLDVAAGLAITLTALDCLNEPLGRRKAAGLALAAGLAPWLSFPSAFVIAGCGATLLVARLRSGQRRDLLILSLIGLGWAASFVVAYHAAQRLLKPVEGMYRFWDFAFLPVWPMPITAERVAASAGILVEVLVNPLNLVIPGWPWLSVLICLPLLALGIASLARRFPAACSMLVLPIALAIIASAMKRYPFHGRLILELVPAFFLLLAAGTDCVWTRDPSRHKVAYAVVLTLLLAYPCVDAVQEAIDPTVRTYNRHGDLHDNVFIRYGPAGKNPTTS